MPSATTWMGARYGLPRAVRILQTGLVVNAFGNGAAAPFLILYLHNVRGIPLPLAGAASATAAGCGLLSAVTAGSIADRVGPRSTMIGGLGCSTVAYCLYPLVRHPWHALVLAVLAGAGIGTWLTMQSSLLAALTPPDLRHVAFAWQRVAANVGLGLGGFAGGMIVTTGRPDTFTALFWLNAATFIVYTVFLVRIPLPDVVPVTRQRGYLQVLADRVFVRLAVLNLVVVAAAISLLNALVPVYAKNQGLAQERAIGTLFLLNSVVIIAIQLRVARMVEGRRRMRAFALMAALFASSWLLLIAAPTTRATIATTVLVLAIIAFSVAECLYDAVYGPLVADLARPDLLSRYMAVTGFSWQLGFIVGPAVGAVILNSAGGALWPAAAAVCLAAGAYALRLDRRLPEAVRITNPRTAPAPTMPTGQSTAPPDGLTTPRAAPAGGGATGDGGRAQSHAN
jgi:MFS family permease